MDLKKKKDLNMDIYHLIIPNFGYLPSLKRIQENKNVTFLWILMKL